MILKDFTPTESTEIFIAYEIDKNVPVNKSIMYGSRYELMTCLFKIVNDYCNRFDEDPADVVHAMEIYFKGVKW